MDSFKNIPYGKQTIETDDINALNEVLNENTYLTTGPRVNKFEEEVCKYIGCKYGVAVNSGTAALHCATFAANIKENDEVIVPAISFVATANAVLYQKGKPVFCDVIKDTLNLNPECLEPLITSKTKAVIMVDMCGQPCEYDEIRKICNKHKLILIQDAAHSLGGNYKNNKVGSYADITCLSFHPVKNITTCEGGMMVTNMEKFYNLGKSCRSHGILRDYKQREKSNSHYYEMTSLGFNYRLPDVLCALGINQLKKLDSFIERRNEIALKYNNFFDSIKEYAIPLKNNHYNAYHIYVIKFNCKKIGKTRDELFQLLKNEGIGVNVHYMPIYLHPYYKDLGYEKGLCPVAEMCYQDIITIPIYPLLTDEEVNYVCEKINKVLFI
jgi:perosamine synthetase